MEAWGAPADDISAVRARIDAAAPPEPDPFGVHADNWETVQAFQALAPRWHYAGMLAQRTGFDWAGVEAWIDRHIRRRRRRALSVGLMTMERAVLQADCELREKESKR